MSTAEENESYAAEYGHLSLVEIAKKMDELREAKENCESVLTDINKRYDFLRLSGVPGKMDDQGVSTMAIAGIGRVYLTSDIYASIVKDKKREALQWLCDIGKGDLIQDNINPSTLKAVLKDMLSKGEDIPESLFNVTPFTRAAITKRI